MKRKYELQSNAFKNAWDIYRKNYGKVSWSKSCKLGWDLAKKGIVLRKKKPVRIKEAAKETVTAETVYNTYHKDVYKFLLKRSFYNSDVAEEATSQTFEKVCKKIHTFDNSKGTLKTWVLTIARNILIDNSRSLSERNNANTKLIESYVDEDGNSIYQLDGHTMMPDEIAENKENKNKVNKALSKLDEKYRQAAIMFLVEGMKLNEIAEMLEIPLNTVKTHISRARAMLQKELQGVY
jgi:RNA polymerase sigma-70 factor (ECF subfamily)